jgi:hypothetical protein
LYDLGREGKTKEKCLEMLSKFLHSKKKAKHNMVRVGRGGKMGFLKEVDLQNH